MVASAVTGPMAATAAAENATQISISSAPKVGVYHDKAGGQTADVARQRGALTQADGTPVAGATVTLERKLSSDADWTALGDKTTDADGKYTFYSYVEGNAQYKVSFAGDATNASSESAPVRLKAMRDFNATVVEKTRYAVLKGNINPGWDHKVVHWQKKSCKTCTWKTVGKDRSGKNGEWSFQGAYAPVGKHWYFRATLDGADDFVKSYSDTLITTTKRARTVR
jgi:hypothetical protein